MEVILCFHESMYHLHGSLAHMSKSLGAPVRCWSTRWTNDLCDVWSLARCTRESHLGSWAANFSVLCLSDERPQKHCVFVCNPLEAKRNIK